MANRNIPPSVVGRPARQLAEAQGHAMACVADSGEAVVSLRIGRQVDLRDDAVRAQIRRLFDAIVTDPRNARVYAHEGLAVCDLHDELDRARDAQVFGLAAQSALRGAGHARRVVAIHETVLTRPDAADVPPIVA